MNVLCDDLAAEHAALDALVASLDPDGWSTPTPAEPWTIGDQISHLAFFDDAARIAATDREAFAQLLERAMNDPEAFMDDSLRGRSMQGAEVLGWWREARAKMLDAFRALDPKARVPWFGPEMGAASKVTARLMETWAHGQDVADALGVEREPTHRLRHVAHIGVRARPFSYAAHEMEAPTDPVRVVLEAPDGETWEWGEGENTVRGPALDFCLVVTQRRHIDDTDLEAEGPLAKEWMGIAQAFAGPPGPGRRPGQFPKRER